MKKKARQRLSALLLTFALTLGLCPVALAADTGYTVFL